jgi:hypothetical protein
MEKQGKFHPRIPLPLEFPGLSIQKLFLTILAPAAQDLIVMLMFDMLAPQKVAQLLQQASGLVFAGHLISKSL